MQLFNVNGQVVLSQVRSEASGTVNEELNISDLNAGVYQLRIITAEGTVLNQSIVKAEE